MAVGLVANGKKTLWKSKDKFIRVVMLYSIEIKCIAYTDISSVSSDLPVKYSTFII